MSDSKYKEYQKKRKEYEVNLATLDKLKRALALAKANLNGIMLQITYKKRVIAFESKKLETMTYTVLNQLDKLSQAEINRYKKEIADKRKIIDATIEHVKFLETRHEDFQKDITRLIDEIEILEIKKENKPFRPPGDSPNKTKKTRVPKAPKAPKTKTEKAPPPEQKRCPNGTRRNKTTGLCEKK
jgi:hypothetical protein